MSEDFISSMLQSQNRLARTANGAITLASTNSDVLDFFSTAGAFRTRSEEDIILSFSRAFSESRELAMKALFYLRDCRGGQGERRLFRVIWNWLIDNYPDLVKKNIAHVPTYGRWDDICYNEKSLSTALCTISKTIDEYKSGTSTYNNLAMFKWLPSINTSSKDTVKLAHKLSKALCMSPRQYRKLLSKARAELGIVERDMSANNWNNIKFEKVPSRASLLYRKAFWKHTPDLYAHYISKVEKGETKINTSVIYPYEVVREYLEARSSNDPTLNVIWDNLPNYIEDGSQALVMADVSGSMEGLPLSVSISLAMYMAERNPDPVFGNHFMTFSKRPSLIKITGSNLFEKITNLSHAHWDMNTNLQAAFDLILETAIRSKLSPDAMPDKLVIVSDMQFDNACGTRTNFEIIKDKYESAGYEMPSIVFWNVNASTSHSPVEFDQKGVMLVSGCSPTIFRNVLSNTVCTPYDLMLEVLNSERYSLIEV